LTRLLRQHTIAEAIVHQESAVVTAAHHLPEPYRPASRWAAFGLGFT
jgi:hypothetical protein